MTVAELIIELQAFDPEIQVVVRDRDDGFLYRMFKPQLSKENVYDPRQYKYVEAPVVIF